LYSYAVYIYIFFSLTLQPPWALASFFSFMIIFTDGRTTWASDQPVARSLPKHGTTQTQNEHLHTSNIHALCGIQTHDPGFRVSEDSSYLRPLGYCDRPYAVYACTKLGQQWQGQVITFIPTWLGSVIEVSVF
jgi:hypothetical protein